MATRNKSDLFTCRLRLVLSWSRTRPTVIRARSLRDRNRIQSADDRAADEVSLAGMI